MNDNARRVYNDPPGSSDLWAAVLVGRNPCAESPPKAGFDITEGTHSKQVE